MKNSPEISFTVFGRNVSLTTIFLLLILALGAVLRLYKLGEIPPGMNQDEASTAYDAFAIAYYGMDRNGYHLPLFLVAWGSGMGALPAYFLIPFYYVFGTSVLTIRFAAALCGIFSIFMFYEIGKLLLSRKQGLIAGFLLAISPWHILQSRWFFEAAFLPIFFLLGFYFQLLFFKKDNKAALYLSAIFFGLAVYTYAPAFFFIPVFAFFSTAYLLLQKWQLRSSIFGATFVFALLLLPFAYYVGINSLGLPEINTAVVSIPKLPSAPLYQSVLNSYSLEKMSGRILKLANVIGSQNDGLIWNVIPEFGFLFYGSSILAVFGLFASGYLLVIKRNYGFGLVFIWLLVATIQGGMQEANVNRMNMAVLLFMLLTSIAVAVFCRKKIVTAIILLVYICFVVNFSAFFFSKYSERISGTFFESFTDAIAAVPEDGKRVCVTDGVQLPYIFVGFIKKISPKVFLSSVVYERPGEEFQRVRSFDRYIFGLHNCELARIGTYVLRNDELGRLGTMNFAKVIPFKRYTVLIQE